MLKFDQTGKKLSEMICNQFVASCMGGQTVQKLHPRLVNLILIKLITGQGKCTKVCPRNLCFSTLVDYLFEGSFDD